VTEGELVRLQQSHLILGALCHQVAKRLHSSE
jgi:hypothetical protein